MALTDNWDSDITVSELLDRSEAKQALRSQDRLEVIMGLMGLFQDAKSTEAGMQELFKLSLGALAEMEKG